MGEHIFRLEAMAGAIVLGGLFGIYRERTRTGRGIGVRVIQLATVCMLVPVVFILALERTLDSATVGTLLGAVAGYILSGIGRDECLHSS